jgi:hypothetical protein
MSQHRNTDFKSAPRGASRANRISEFLQPQNGSVSDSGRNSDRSRGACLGVRVCVGESEGKNQIKVARTIEDNAKENSNHKHNQTHTNDLIVRKMITIRDKNIND